MGYLPRDLLMSRGFIERGRVALERIAEDLRQGPAVLVGLATPNPCAEGRPLFNSAALIDQGTVGPIFHKTLLPTYDVFDEDRYFEPAQGPQVLEFQGRRLGISICEDVWNDRNFWQRRRYHEDPIELLSHAGVDCIVNLSASPFTAGKQALRESMLAHMARERRLPLAYVNQMGGNDDLIFDGRSCAFDEYGRLIARAKRFADDVLMVDLESATGSIAEDDFTPEAEIWAALVARRTRLRAQDRISKGAAWAIGRYRFRSHRRHCRGRHGTGECSRRDDALALLQPRQRRRFRRIGRATWEFTR